MSSNSNDKCIVCGGDLSYSIPAQVLGYCELCKPEKCLECGCVDIKRDYSENTVWECDNGCKFEVTTPSDTD